MFFLRGSGDGQLQLLNVDELVPGLKPLVMWMANSIELLHFIQHDVPQLLPWRQDQEDEGGLKLITAVRPVACCNLCLLNVCVFSGLLDSEMLSTRTACEEAMTVLEEVIMFTFQQSVYYLTKVPAHTVTSACFKSS